MAKIGFGKSIFESQSDALYKNIVDVAAKSSA